MARPAAIFREYDMKIKTTPPWRRQGMIYDASPSPLPAPLSHCLPRKFIRRSLQLFMNGCCYCNFWRHFESSARVTTPPVALQFGLRCSARPHHKLKAVSVALTSLWKDCNTCASNKNRPSRYKSLHLQNETQTQVKSIASFRTQNHECIWEDLSARI